MKISKRAFIRLVALGGSLLSGVGAVTARASEDASPLGKARLLNGPMLGAVTRTSIRIWLQASDRYRVSIEVSRTADFQDSQTTTSVRLSAANDFAVVISVDSLQAATRYYYRVLIGGKTPSYSADPNSQYFTTAPPMDSRFSIAFGSCAKYAEDSQQLIWDRVSEHSPDLFFWLGDSIYGDSPRPEILADEYRRQRGVETFLPVGSRIPQLAIWDDHDFGENDGDRTFHGKTGSLDVFKRYWANPGFGTDDAPGVFFAYEYGGVDFFFLDVRYYRDPNAVADNEQKTMLGESQKNWLKAALLRSTAPFKILISGSAWSAGKGPGDDSWSAFMHERDELFDYIRDENVDGVVLISGDTHVAELNAIPWSERGAYDLYDLTSSPLAQDTSASWLERRPERRIRQVYFGSVNFGSLKFDLTADDPVLEYNVVNYIGDEVWEPMQIRASELTNGSSSWYAKMDSLSRERYESAREGGEYYQSLPHFREDTQGRSK